MPDTNQNLIIRVLLLIFVTMVAANTIAQFLQITYKEPFYLSTWLLPCLGVVIYSYYKNRSAPKQRVLVVEDQEFWRTLLNFCLKDQCKIIYARSAEEALRYLQTCPAYELPERAIIDQNLPDMTGVELIREINRMGLDLDITILSVAPPDPNSPEQHFVDMWLLKIPETFRDHGGLIEAMKPKPLTITIKESIFHILKLPNKKQKRLLKIEKRDDQQEPPSA